MKDSGIDQFVIYLMERVIKNYRRTAMSTLRSRQAGITLDQWIILKQISEKNGASQVEIGMSAIKDAPTTTRIIDQLSNKGLVIKKQDDKDRRRFQVFVTSKGLLLIRKLWPAVKSYREDSLRDFSRMEILQLEQFLKRILDNLDKRQ